MQVFKKIKFVTAFLVFAISFMVFAYSAEPTGSLWDCGEFILGAYKLEVVHPPGAPLFVLIGRMFTFVADAVSSNPENIAYSMNLLSGLCTAFAAMFICLITMMFGQISLIGKDAEPTAAHGFALCGAGLVGGLTAAFCSSVWFSAVEGEVYAMSTFFTALTVWAATKWYTLPDTPKTDKWLIFTFYAMGLSIGVHLLSLLAMPFVALLYYYKKFDNHTLLGGLGSFAAGMVVIGIIQKLIIVGIPNLWKNFEIFMVNSLGMPFHTGLIPTILVLVALAFLVLRYAKKHNKYFMHLATIATIMVTISFSTIGVIVIRANADTPVNMNVPSDVLRLLPYINREQYGERPLLYGPHFDAQPSEVEQEDRLGRVGDKYVKVDEKYTYKYRSQDKMLLPRVSHSDPMRKQLYREWWGKERGKPGMAFNLAFMVRYQWSWMYARYFMWNFVGKQNGKQGFNPTDKSSGNWMSGLGIIDESRIHSLDKLPDSMKNDEAYNKYYFLPLIFGLLGLFFHAKNSDKEFLAVLILFLITGLGIIMYSNQPPSEPRERDYVLVGSFITFAIWVGMGVLAMFKLLSERVKLGSASAAYLGTALVLSAPVIMAFQNMDDHSRRDHYGARDYASNFLESCVPNSIIFTYGDNDTYPLWYAQEVEGIRTDVRVVNLSLIAVDWYIEKLRRKVNDSPPLKLTIPTESYRGNLRNQVFFFDPGASRENQEEALMQPRNLKDELTFIGSPKNIQQNQTIMRTRRLILPVDLEKAARDGIITEADSSNIVPAIPITLSTRKSYITKDDLAVMDVIASNYSDRAIYFATTCKNEKLLGLNDYMQFEGLALRLVPIRTPSDRSLSIYGSGKIATDILYDNVMNKFRWGNFDTHDTFIDDSYGAEIQSHRMIMMRAGEQLLKEGKKQEAANIVNKYFDSFPHMNFPYTPFLVPLLEVLVKGGDYESAKKHIRILANEISQNLDFFSDIGPEVVSSSYRVEYLYAVEAVDEVLNLSKQVSDGNFEQEMKDLLNDYKVVPVND